MVAASMQGRLVAAVTKLCTSYAAISPLGHVCTHLNCVCRSLFTAALYEVAEDRRQPKFPLLGTWLNQIGASAQWISMQL